MLTLKGNPVSPGFALSRVYIHKTAETPDTPQYVVEADEATFHWSRFERAVEERASEIQAKINTLSPDVDKTHFDMLTVYLLMLHDPDFLEQVNEKLFKHKVNIERAVWEVSRNMAQKLLECEDAILRERAADIYGMSDSLIRRLLSIEETSLDDLTAESIIVAQDLSPAEALSMNRALVKGIALEGGSYTSHLAILARSFGIPAVFGLADLVKTTQNSALMALNGASGEVFIQPDNKKQQEISAYIKNYRERQLELGKIRGLKAVTKSGKEIILKANIQNPDEIASIFEYGADGIGLFRTELMFLTSGLAINENTQTEIYTKVMKSAKGKPVTIRTCDIGGDKIPAGAVQYTEKNPLMGWRGIRMSLGKPEMFKMQLRALFRAGVYGDMRVMFPMISALSEMEMALQLAEECKTELRERGAAFNDSIPIGAMIEVPSAALTSDLLAPRCAFFSIGTNDLMQYTLAIDRDNGKTDYLANPKHPALLRLIKMTADAAHEAGITVSVCGEIGANTELTPLLVELGIDELSMNAPSIPEVKQAIMRL